MKVVITDGGRLEAGYRGIAGDCVTRAIAIASGMSYQQVYDDLNRLSQSERATKKMRGKSSSRNGVYKKTYHKYILSLGFKWVSTMRIGSGCKVHLKDGELPQGTLIARLSKHLTAVIDGVIYDTFDPSRSESRCVYGYYLRVK